MANHLCMSAKNMTSVIKKDVVMVLDGEPSGRKVRILLLGMNKDWERVNLELMTCLH